MFITSYPVVRLNKANEANWSNLKAILDFSPEKHQLLSQLMVF